jgi:hypothetical protein
MHRKTEEAACGDGTAAVSPSPSSVSRVATGSAELLGGSWSTYRMG